MSREIKFRAWDKQEQRMIVHEQEFIPLKITSIGVLRLNPHHESTLYDLMDINRFDITQFTGVKEKRTEIEWYEGDIISFKCGEQQQEMFDFIGQIRFMYGGFVIESPNCYRSTFELSELDGNQSYLWRWEGSLASQRSFYYIATEFKKIGNIYENPELF